MTLFTFALRTKFFAGHGDPGQNRVATVRDLLLLWVEQLFQQEPGVCPRFSLREVSNGRTNRTILLMHQILALSRTEQPVRDSRDSPYPELLPVDELLHLLVEFHVHLLLHRYLFQTKQTRPSAFRRQQAQ